MSNKINDTIKTVFNSNNQFEKFSSVKSICIKEAKLNERPIITIAIPTYKRPETLAFAIDSVINQVGSSDIEVVVVDNNPEFNDSTHNLMQQYSDSRIAYYKNSENIGMTGNWNRLFELAKGDWVVMLHDDDALLPIFIHNIKRLLKIYGNKSDAFYFGTVNDYMNVKYKDRFVIRKINHRDLCYQYNLATGGMMVRRETVLELGGFDNSFYPSADYHFAFKLLYFARAYGIWKCPMVFYRIGINETYKANTIKGFSVKNEIINTAAFSNRSYFFRWLMKHYIKYQKWYCPKNSLPMVSEMTPDLLNYLEDIGKDLSFFDKICFLFFNKWLGYLRRIQNLFSREFMKVDLEIIN